MHFNFVLVNESDSTTDRCQMAASAPRCRYDAYRAVLYESINGDLLQLDSKDLAPNDAGTQRLVALRNKLKINHFKRCYQLWTTTPTSTSTTTK